MSTVPEPMISSGRRVPLDDEWGMGNDRDEIAVDVDRIDASPDLAIHADGHAARSRMRDRVSRQDPGAKDVGCMKILALRRTQLARHPGHLGSAGGKSLKMT